MSTDTMERPVVAAPVVALTPPQRAAVALNTAEYEIKLRELLTNSVGILAVTNKAGRDECHTAYMVLKNTRCTITNLSEGATEDAKAFTKAVKAEAVRLIAITTAEQARKDAIQADIDRLRAIPAALVGKSSDDLAFARKDMLSMTVNEARFAEFTETARTVVADIINRIELMLTAEIEREKAALAAEEARKATEKRAAEEAAAVAKQKAENERITNDLAIAAKRLADQEAANALAAKQLADKVAANLKADQDALAEQVRLQREAATEAQRKIDAQQADIDAKRAAFAREQEEAAARVEAAAKMEADHADALIEDAQFNADREAERVRKQAMADQHLADKRNLPLPESCCARDARIDSGEEDELTDNDITKWGAEVGLDKTALVARLRKYVADADADALVAA